MSANTKLRLCLVGDAAVIQRLATPDRLWLARVRQRANGPRQTGPNQRNVTALHGAEEVQKCLDLAATDPQQVEATLAQALQTFETPDAPLDRAVLEVRLGLRAAFVGLLRIDQTPSDDAYAARVIDAWLERRLHVDASTQLVRWQAQGPGLVLVSCIARELYETLQRLAAQRRMRLGPCTPAVLDRVTQLQRDCARRRLPQVTLAWSEACLRARRHGAVQMFRVTPKGVCADWRGWVNAPTADGPDSEYEGALRRFQIAHGVPEDELTVREHWNVTG